MFWGASDRSMSYNKKNACFGEKTRTIYQPTEKKVENGKRKGPLTNDKNT